MHYYYDKNSNMISLNTYILVESFLASELAVARFQGKNDTTYGKKFYSYSTLV